MDNYQEEEKRGVESKRGEFGKLLPSKKNRFERNVVDLSKKYDELSRKYDAVTANLNLWIDAQRKENNLQMDLNDLNQDKFTNFGVYIIHMNDTMNKIADIIEDSNTKREIVKTLKLSRKVANDLNAGGDPDTMFMKKNFLDIERRIRS